MGPHLPRLHRLAPVPNLMRSALLIISITLSYTLLRGWPEPWHPIIRVCLAVSALVVAFALWGQAKKTTTNLAKPARKPRLLDYLTVGIAILLVECFFLVFLSLAPPQTVSLALSLDEALHPEIYQNDPQPTPNQTTPNAPPGSDGPLITSNWLFSGPGPRTLNKNKKVTPSNKPELYLFPASKGDAKRLTSTALFLRSFTLATYQAGAWLPQPAIPRTLKANGQALTIPRQKKGPSVTYDISHPVNPYGRTLAVTIPDFTSIQLPSLRQTSPATFRLPASAAQNNNYRYTATSVLVPFDQLPPIIAPGVSPSPTYLELPADPTLRQKIQTLAATFGPPSRASLSKLRNHLRSHYQYSLNLNMPEEADPLDSFLFNTRTGYCTHFATATVMLTRAMGIPSRIAFGWSGGRYFEGPNLFVFRAREAHAWTEIYLADHGWVILETTPAGREEGTPSRANSGEAPPIPDLLGDSSEPTSHTDLAPLRSIATWLGLASAIALLITLLLRRTTTPPHQHTSTTNLLPDPPHYLSAFRRACHTHGHPIPPGRTLRAHLALIDAPPFATDLLNYHYSVQYADASPSKPTEKKLLKHLKNWEKSAYSKKNPPPKPS